eukprot:TRINITY_DN3607_c3_g2_i1.p1 TRINITY_DN3607_c3_g2~~TRINITY_DN3607_c3_g2_i1.p1  ORF type:complete len:449 (-),score=94.08 TRINITY_DN3607_c3_g2_i1:14-1360(-)
MAGNYNMRNPAVKRLLQEAREMQKDPNERYTAAPLDDDIFEWHFTIAGPEDSPYAGGRYHGRILLPPEYPFKPPNIMLSTPSGRFELHTKICLSISAHHPEEWQPSWSIRTVLVALMAFMPTKGKGAIGAIDYPAEECQRLARESLKWKCDRCHAHMATALPTPSPPVASEAAPSPPAPETPRATDSTTNPSQQAVERQESTGDSASKKAVTIDAPPSTSSSTSGAGAGGASEVVQQLRLRVQRRRTTTEDIPDIDPATTLESDDDDGDDTATTGTPVAKPATTPSTSNASASTTAGAEASAAAPPPPAAAPTAAPPAAAAAAAAAGTGAGPAPAAPAAPAAAAPAGAAEAQGGNIMEGHMGGGGLAARLAGNMNRLDPLQLRREATEPIRRTPGQLGDSTDLAYWLWIYIMLAIMVRLLLHKYEVPPSDALEQLLSLLGNDSKPGEL